jgi:hypothetical protein
MTMAGETKRTTKESAGQRDVSVEMSPSIPGAVASQTVSHYDVGLVSRTLDHKNDLHIEIRLMNHITSHHQAINVPTAGAQAFLMDYPQAERAITHHAGPVRIGG